MSSTASEQLPCPARTRRWHPWERRGHRRSEPPERNPFDGIRAGPVLSVLSSRYLLTTCFVVLGAGWMWFDLDLFAAFAAFDADNEGLYIDQISTTLVAWAVACITIYALRLRYWPDGSTRLVAC